VTYVAFASAKASPGVTTTLAALAATWPAERPLLVAELDPAGGDLAVRFDLSPEPGLVTLAAAGRRDLDDETLLAHTQVVPGQGQHHPQHGAARRVLPAPVAPDQASAALVALRGRLSDVLRSVDLDVLVDCGRLDQGSPAYRIATEADLLVMVVRPIVAEVHHLTGRIASLELPEVSLLLVGEHPYSVEEVADAVRATPMGTLPHDPRAAAALSGGQPNALRTLRRSRLLRSAHALADGLAQWLGPAPATAEPVGEHAAATGTAHPPAPHVPPPPPPGARPLPVPPPPPGMHPTPLSPLPQRPHPQPTHPTHPTPPGEQRMAPGQTPWPPAPPPANRPRPSAVSPNGDGADPLVP
jgi:MinD-like ATPase involved in chromosome partitioning or flagellar assembly